MKFTRRCVHLQFKSEFKENYLALTSLKIPSSLAEGSSVYFSRIFLTDYKKVFILYYSQPCPLQFSYTTSYFSNRYIAVGGLSYTFFLSLGKMESCASKQSYETDTLITSNLIKMQHLWLCYRLAINVASSTAEPLQGAMWQSLQVRMLVWFVVIFISTRWLNIYSFIYISVIEHC